MSELKEWAALVAERLTRQIYMQVNSGQIHHAIESAILRGMVEALEAEPDEGMMTEAYACSGISIKAMWRAMAAARAREIKEGK